MGFGWGGRAICGGLIVGAVGAIAAVEPLSASIWRTLGIAAALVVGLAALVALLWSFAVPHVERIRKHARIRLPEAHDTRVPHDPQYERFIDEGRELMAEEIHTLDEREAWNERLDHWRIRASEWLHDRDPALAREFLERSKVEDELPVWPDWGAVFDGHHGRELVLTDRGVRALERFSDAGR